MPLLSRGRQPEKASSVSEEALLEQFSAHFPALFAYVYSRVGREEEAREIAAAAFIQAVTSRLEQPDVEFRLLLFGLARRACQAAALASGPASDGLRQREREVLSLIFDGQLCREEVAQLLGIKEDVVARTLVRGLKKLRARGAAVAMAPLPRLT